MGKSSPGLRLMGKMGLSAPGTFAPVAAAKRSNPGTTRSSTFWVSTQRPESIGLGSRRIHRSLSKSIGEAQVCVNADSIFPRSAEVNFPSLAGWRSTVGVISISMFLGSSAPL